MKKRMKAAGVGSSGPQEAPATSAGVPLHGRDYAAACLYAVASLAVYVWTLGPTVTGEDSGELIAAAYTLGIPHPPGYPTWTMLAHAFTWLPFGNVAWRVNLMSAVFAALTVALTFLLARKLSLPRWASAAAAMVLAFSRELWEQAVIAEVYTLNAFFFVSCVLLLFLWQESGRKSALLTLAAVYGVSLGNHNTMALVGPCFALYLLYLDREPWLRWRLYGGAAVVALLDRAIRSIVDAKEDKDLDSLFTGTRTTALTNTISGLNDFELMSFLVVQDVSTEGNAPGHLEETTT